MMDIIVNIVKVVVIVYFFQEILKVVKVMYRIPSIGRISRKEAWLLDDWLRPGDVVAAERLLRGRKPKEVKK